MPIPQVENLAFDVIEAEHKVIDMERVHGLGSAQHDAAKKQFLRLWFMLKMSRRQSEFLKEVTR